MARHRAIGAEGTLQYMVQDAEKMSFEDNLFDAVIAFNLLHHFPNILKLSYELLRVCKPGGYIFTFDPNRLNPHSFLCQEPISPVRYDRFTINERAIHPKELTVFDQKNISTKFLSVELKKSSKNYLYHKLYGFIERSIQSRGKRILAFFIFNTAHLITIFLPKKYRNGVVMGIIQKNDTLSQ
jgi:SAM-dependent methyltransferase